VQSHLCLFGVRVGVSEELDEEGVADPSLVPVRCPAAAVHEQVPGVRTIERPQDVGGSGDVDSRGEGSEFVEPFGKTAEDGAELGLDPLLLASEPLPVNTISSVRAPTRPPTWARAAATACAGAVP
jgi:hypothetical protein